MDNHGTLHFYTDDYRFNTVFEHPEKILNMHPANIVEPNFSLFNETPIAFGMQSIYKKRMIARQLQEVGINVFVDLNVAVKFYKMNLVGVPKGYRSFCTRGYSDRISSLHYEWEIAKLVRGGDDILFVCYGGGEKCHQWCKEHNAVYVTPIVKMKKIANDIEKMKESIAFFGTSIKLEQNIPSIDDLMKKQLADYSVNKRIGNDG